MEFFENSLQHLLAELERIDLLIAAQVARARNAYRQDEQFRGLYIPEEEVDDLLNQPAGRPRWTNANAGDPDIRDRLEQIRHQIDQRKTASLKNDIDLRLLELQRLFALSAFEMDILLVCLGVELDLRYERLYAYLQDDVTKKRPSVDLVLNLLTFSTVECLTARHYFAHTAPLVRHRIIEIVEDPSQPHPPLLAKYLKLDHRVVQYLVGGDEPDTRLQPFAWMYDNSKSRSSVLVNDATKHRLSRFIQNNDAGNGVIIYLAALYGAGRQDTAAAICSDRQLSLLVVDLEALVDGWDTADDTPYALLNREAKLQNAAVYWKGFDTLLVDKRKPACRFFLHQLQYRSELTFLAGDERWQPNEDFRGVPFARIKFSRQQFKERLRIWQTALDGIRFMVNKQDIADLATKFKFTGGQILDAAATATNIARQRDANTLQLKISDMYEACYLHSNQRISSLARKITPKYQWADIVLPDDRLEQLREICNHVRYREHVYGEWGFDDKLSLGKGLSVLFDGPSGTGKTMAAEIIAGTLHLELYKIDLSSVVSKYIGETEKNLGEIFSEAELSNAILFFDEADALFGKRSEVKDSHDRYANIETGYLLQRMEEYEGIVILSTNLRKNMDEAFTRRIGHTVTFPFPGKTDRSKIWSRIWHRKTPLSPDLDFEFMADEYEITGGNIKNIAVGAAFLAASEKSKIKSDHLFRATRREYQKMGKVIIDGGWTQISKTLPSNDISKKDKETWAKGA